MMATGTQTNVLYLEITRTGQRYELMRYSFPIYALNFGQWKSEHA